MSSPRRLKGNGDCCGEESWEAPYRLGPYDAGPQYYPEVTEAERDASRLIEGDVLWATKPDGARLLPTPGLPHPAHDEALRREAAALAVIANGRGLANRILDTFPRPADWYRANGTAQNLADRERDRAEQAQKYGDAWPAHKAVTPWCLPCQSAGEELLEGLQYSLGEIAPVVRGVALIASYVPVLGTAVSYVLNATISLAQGEKIDRALFDALGRSLPGQPVSGAAFDAVRSIANGDRLDQVAIQALPIPADAKEAVSSAVTVFEQIARGRPVTGALLEQVKVRLPPAARRTVDVAERLVDGEGVADLLVDEGARAAASAARAAGPEAARRYVAEAGYRAALDNLPLDLGTAVAAGLAAGETERQNAAFVGEFDVEERDVASNDALALRGRRVLDAGAVWRGRPLKAVRDGATFTWTRSALDPLSGATMRRTDVYVLDDAWRRGFEVAVGLCEGASSETAEQERVKATLEQASKAGFDVGRFAQIERSFSEYLSSKSPAQLALAISSPLSFAAPAPSAARLSMMASASSAPRLVAPSSAVTSAAALSEAEGRVDAARRLLERQGWVEHYLER